MVADHVMLMSVCTRKQHAFWLVWFICHSYFLLW